MESLKTDADYLQWMSIASSSRRTYQQGQQAFAAFCNNISTQPYPLNEGTLRLFVTFIAHSLSFATIQTYLASVRHRHIELGFASNFNRMDSLRLLLRGVKRVKGSRVRQPRIPVTPLMLRQLKESLRQSQYPEADKLMLWAAFTTAFFGFLRSSEFCSASKHSFNPQTTLLVRNVTITGGIASIWIKVSKTDPFRQGQTIRIAASGSSICPVRALQKHLQNCTNEKQPLFTFQDKTFLTRQTLSGLVKQLLGTSELQGLSSHSFRIGAATTAAAAKVPDWLIKTLGRWSSNCYEQYIRTPDNVIESIPSVLVNTVVRRSEFWQP